MVIAGGVQLAWRRVRRLLRFNGAGDGDRRRGLARGDRVPRATEASTEPAMVIAGGPGDPGALSSAREVLQRSRRW